MTIQQLLAKHTYIGTLNRKGETIYYINFPVYREARHPLELIDNV